VIESLLLCTASFILAIGVIPIQIRKFREKGIVVPDYYKNHLKYVPTAGGISIMAVFFALLILMTFLAFFVPPTHSVRIGRLEGIAALIIALFALFGVLDDFVDVGRVSKIIIPFFLALPIGLAVDNHPVVIPGIGSFKLGLLYLYLIAPLYIMVVSNLVNMHSGFNGLAAGLSSILLATLLLKSLINHGNLLVMNSIMLGAVAGFLIYNWYPSRIFDGNTGALAIGAAIGILIVANGYLVSGFIMLLPHTVNFLMYVYWRVMRRLRPDDERWKLVKFGKVRRDGTLDVPNALTLKWVLPYHFRMTERQVVLAMYGLTAAFCAVGFVVPY
jgi:UDP-N-acetylglucosamine--dolichyl-phosphate N-acetylglucosaminephosphotransferase